MISRLLHRRISLYVPLSALGVFVILVYMFGAISTSLRAVTSLVLVLLALSLLIAAMAPLGRDQRVRGLIRFYFSHRGSATANGLVRNGQSWRIARLPRLTSTGFEVRIVPALGISRDMIAAQCLTLAQDWNADAVQIRSVPGDGRFLRFCVATTDALRDPFDYEPMRITSPIAELGSGVIAKADDGNPFRFDLWHTLLVGRSGSGKSSALFALLSLVVDAQLYGDQRPLVYACDPKMADLSTPAARQLFDGHSTEPQEIADLIESVYLSMMLRRGHGERYEDQPIVLVVDELVTALAAGGDRQLAAQIEGHLLEITRLGRSLHVILIAASLVATKDVIGKLRDGLVNRVCLGIANSSDVDLVLGNGARARGALADKIPVATAANGYSSAGIAYVADDHDEIHRVRFPHVSQEELCRWHERRQRRSNGEYLYRIPVSA